MKTSLPFSDGTDKIVSTGDIIELVDGTKITFHEMKRSKWIGYLNGRGTNVPIYRSKNRATGQLSNPYAKAIVGRDESKIIAPTNPSTFTQGDLFYLEGHKETFMYIGDKTKRTGREMVRGIDLSSKKIYNIAKGMTMIKIDLNKVKDEISKIND